MSRQRSRFYRRKQEYRERELDPAPRRPDATEPDEWSRGARSHLMADGSVKPTYPSLDKAFRAADRARERFATFVQPYECAQRPQHWHLGTPNRSYFGPDAERSYDEPDRG